LIPSVRQQNIYTHQIHGKHRLHHLETFSAQHLSEAFVRINQVFGTLEGDGIKFFLKLGNISKLAFKKTRPGLVGQIGGRKGALHRSVPGASKRGRLGMTPPCPPISG
jgi:hypothetical protein